METGLENKEKGLMKCVICKLGDVAEGATTVALERGGCAILFRNVPAKICTNCGEDYVDDDVASALLAQAERAAVGGAELQIVRFAA